MKRCFSAILMLSLPGISIAHAEDDPWAPARTGKIECVNPDFASKTCDSMAVYHWNHDGTIISEDTSILIGIPGIVQSSRTEVTLQGSRMCVVPDARRIEATTFQRDGREVSPQEADGYRRSLLAAYEPAFGRKLCVDISPYGNQYIVQITVDGNELPSATARLAWIDAKDGFHLSN